MRVSSVGFGWHLTQRHETNIGSLVVKLISWLSTGLLKLLSIIGVPLTIAICSPIEEHAGHAWPCSIVLTVEIPENKLIKTRFDFGAMSERARSRAIDEASAPATLEVTMVVGIFFSTKDRKSVV